MGVLHAYFGLTPKLLERLTSSYSRWSEAKLPEDNYVDIDKLHYLIHEVAYVDQNAQARETKEVAALIRRAVYGTRQLFDYDPTMLDVVNGRRKGQRPLTERDVQDNLQYDRLVPPDDVRQAAAYMSSLTVRELRSNFESNKSEDSFYCKHPSGQEHFERDWERARDTFVPLSRFYRRAAERGEAAYIMMY